MCACECVRNVQEVHGERINYELLYGPFNNNNNNIRHVNKRAAVAPGLLRRDLV